MNETALDASEYLQSVALTEEPDEVYVLNGAALWRLTDDHYVVLTCTNHEHKGQELLLRVLPRDWTCFHSAANTDAGYQAHHYGPEN